MSRRVVDCVTVFNETDLFEIRFQELRHVVDVFVLVEATSTHKGHAKPILFADTEARFAGYPNTIIHHVVDDLPTMHGPTRDCAWILENFHRNGILRALVDLHLADDDVILISDVDEIPKAAAVQEMLRLLPAVRVVMFQQHMKKYFLNHVGSNHFNDHVWLGTVGCTYRDAKDILPQNIRIGDLINPRSARLLSYFDGVLRPYERHIADAGWHFSSMGGLAAVGVKNASIVEGDRFDRVVLGPHDRFGTHNHASFRAAHFDQLATFLTTHAPTLHRLRGLALDDLEGLDLPDFLKQNASRFEHLFYLADAL